MNCSNCGTERDDGKRFCRICGSDLGSALIAAGQGSSPQKKGVAEKLSLAHAKDPDELTGNGIASVFIGDGFLMVAVILSATGTAVSSLLWLLLLIPAFFYFGKGFSDVLLARQIRRRSKPQELDAQLSPPRASFAEMFEPHTSGQLVAAPSVTERTTRQLK